MNADFFRINFPYLITKESNGKWVAYNRDFTPLPYNDKNESSIEKQWRDQWHVSSIVGNVDEKLLIDLADDISEIQRDEDQKVIKFFLYSDDTDPIKNYKQDPELWKKYCVKLKKLTIE